MWLVVHGTDCLIPGTTRDICESTVNSYAKAHRQRDHLLMGRSLHKLADETYSNVEKA